jgi:hypothetical protein
MREFDDAWKDEHAKKQNKHLRKTMVEEEYLHDQM